MKTSSKIITLAALSASRRHPSEPPKTLAWVIFAILAIILTLCAGQRKEVVVSTAYDDSVYIKCSTDSECERMHGHDMYGNPVGRQDYDIPTKGFKMPK